MAGRRHGIEADPARRADAAQAEGLDDPADLFALPRAGNGADQMGGFADAAIDQLLVADAWIANGTCGNACAPCRDAVTTISRAAASYTACAPASGDAGVAVAVPARWWQRPSC